MSGGDFLSRWSKRKRAVVRKIAPARDLAVSEEDGSERASRPEELAEGETLPPEELAKLPSLDSLTAETDLTQFLRAGVPMVMRKAALRRMWSIDTNIRDYVSEAREYAYDWNAVGGVPGNGPLLPTDDIKAMLRDIFDGSPVEEAEPEPTTAEAEPIEAERPGEESIAATSDHEIESAGAEKQLVALPQNQPSSAVPLAIPSPVDAAMPKPRRHGRAVPL
ncbi:DUF3306 domain-containing protein [Methylobacterium sp. Leaf93]|uniref:DUF3306 domain-containing protein n=1 Tax=Methylobacterium sp. Leaf93 TaxID=1736249 RepID=UPI0006F6055A|nr:DUF3306 domain-containing protein [Methylobacterium sp. Leaf93]KQP12117.1 hypothetical protein ASF26_20330 [Methylobacterium sp. Leaf93]